MSEAETIKELRDKIEDLQRQLQQLTPPRQVNEDDASPIVTPTSQRTDHHQASTRRLLRDIDLKEGFGPRCERDYDDLWDRMERLCQAHGHELSLLPEVVMKAAHETILYKITEAKLHTLSTVKEFRDQLARTLYPFSQEIDNVIREITKHESREDVEDLIVWFERKVLRYNCLRVRWDHPNALHDYQLKNALMSKLSSSLQAEAMRSEWRTIAFSDFTQHVLKSADNLSRLRQGQRQATVQVASIAETVPIMGMKQLSSQPVITVYDDVKQPKKPCYWCKAVGHWSRECPQKPTCDNCGRSGHTTETCFSLRHNHKLGRSNLTVTDTKSGMVVKLKEDESSLAVAESLQKYYGKMRENILAAKDRAAKRKEHQVKEEVDANMEVDESTMGVTINAVINRQGGLYAHLHVGMMPVTFLCDGGADASVMKWSTFMTLPLHTRASFVPVTDGEERAYSFIDGSSFDYEGTVELPVRSPIGDVLETFIVSKKARTDLLGNSWIRAMHGDPSFVHNEFISSQGRFPLVPADHLGLQPASIAVTSAVESMTLDQLAEQCSDELRCEDRQLILSILTEYPEVWRETKLGGAKTYEYAIETVSATPVASPLRHYSPEAKAEISRQVRQLIEAKAIVKSDSPWLSLPVLVEKKTGDKRLCIDYRPLNAVTVPDPYPCSAAQIVIDAIGHAKFYILIDLKNAFHQMRIRENDRRKTAFWSPIGQFEWLCVPFGLLNGTAAMNRFLSLGLVGVDNVVVYVDDIVVFAASISELIENFRRVMARLSEIGACISVRKCRFGLTKIQFLGFEISDGRVSPPSASVKAIGSLERPRDDKMVRRFLGMVGYFRHFIPGFSEVAIPLYELLKRDVRFHWGSEQDTAWEKLKKLLAEVPSLTLPHPEWTYVLDTDASTVAIGACLMQQEPGGKLHPLRFGSRRLTPAERNWPIYELEGFAIVYFLLQFRPYLIGRPFVIHTDHKPLQWLWKVDKPRLARWAMALQQFDFTIIYSPGTQQEHADIFSRDTSFTESDQFVDAHLGSVLGAISVKQRVRRIEGDKIPMKLGAGGLTIECRFPSPQELREAAEADAPVECYVKDTMWVHRGTGRLYVGERIRQQILFYFHYARAGAHRAAQKMIRVVSKFFWWNNLAADCVRFSNGCLTCQRRHNVVKRLGQGHLVATDFNTLVAVDLVGPFHHGGSSFEILTMIDHLTRWVELAVFEAPPTAAQVWNAFYYHWIARLGCPFKLLSDNGSVFVSVHFQDRLKSLGIKTVTSTPYHPAGNSVAEAFHHFLNGAVSRVAALSAWDFTEIVASVLFAYRSTPHIATGESPFKLLTGDEMVLPHWQEWSTYVEQYSKSHADLRYEYITKLRYEAFQRSLLKLASSSQPTDDRIFEVGDLVLIELNSRDVDMLTRVFGGQRLMPRWTEPFRVAKVLNQAQSTFLVESVWHEGVKRQVNKTQMRRFTPMQDPAYRQWYLREARNDRRRHKPGAIEGDVKVASTVTPAADGTQGKEAYKAFAKDLIYPSEHPVVEIEAESPPVSRKKRVRMAMAPLLMDFDHAPLRPRMFVSQH